MSNSNYSSRRAAVASFAVVVANFVILGSVFAQQSNDVGTSALGNGSSKAPRTTVSPNTGSLTAIPDDFSDLVLAPGFLLDLQVYDEPQLSTRARVDKEGDVSLPLIGSVHVAGKTVSAAEKTIQDKFLQEQILKNPQVTLNVEQYAAANITVLGEVQSPGRIQLLAPHSLLDIIGMAGGETNLAGDTIQVKSPTKEGTSDHIYHYSRSSNGDSIRDVMIQPGDTIRVDRAGIVYVLGAVNRPGGYIMQEDGKLNVAQALALALGTSLQAKIGSVRVVRHASDGQLQDIPVPYKQIMEGKVKPLTLQAEDIVYVPVSKLKTVFTTSATLVGQAGAAAIIAAP
jgi:polysaccharide export outer membrane protein